MASKATQDGSGAALPPPLIAERFGEVIPQVSYELVRHRGRAAQIDQETLLSVAFLIEKCL